MSRSVLRFVRCLAYFRMNNSMLIRLQIPPKVFFAQSSLERNTVTIRSAVLDKHSAHMHRPFGGRLVFMDRYDRRF